MLRQARNQSRTKRSHGGIMDMQAIAVPLPQRNDTAAAAEEKQKLH